MTGALVIAILGTTNSGAAGDTAVFPLADSRTLVDGSSVSAPVNCPSARKAVRYYQRRYDELAVKMGVPKSTPAALIRCPHYLAKLWQRKARAMRLLYEREWHWQRWLPRLWYAIGMCETHLDWRFDSGRYVSAFGIITSAFPSWNGRNSPREQYRVALGIAGRYGLNAWGCYSHGGYRYHL